MSYGFGGGIVNCERTRGREEGVLGEEGALGRRDGGRTGGRKGGAGGEGGGGRGFKPKP